MTTYRIYETVDSRRPEERCYAVWGVNLATGHLWLIATRNTLQDARALVAYWRGAGT